MNTPIKVIYILSLGHSGSTLLDLILGSHSQIESVGEIMAFGKYWKSFSDNSLKLEEKDCCTCGYHVNECDYWSKVRYEMEANCEELGIVPSFNSKEEINENTYCLLKAVLKISGKKIVCDSSKNLLRLKNYLKSELFEVFILHLVRDSRAVAYSWAKKRVHSEKEAQYSYYNVLKRWQKFNINNYSSFSNFTNYFCLRYEDLVSDTPHTISKILEKNSLEFESDQLQFWKLKHHNLYGNRMRRRGNQEIKIDSSYLEKLSHQEWWLGTLLTASGLRLFDYSIQRKYQLK